MTRHAAFLRAINVGGRRVTNSQLAAAVSQAGFSDVTTFLASGNLILDVGDGGPAAVQDQVEKALQTQLGFASEVFVRTAGQLDAILGAQPFTDDAVTAAATAPQIAFLRSPLEDTTATAVRDLSTDDDILRVIGSELHWLPMKGVGRADLDWGRLSPLLGVNTVRSINTVRRIRPKLE